MWRKLTRLVSALHLRVVRSSDDPPGMSQTPRLQEREGPFARGAKIAIGGSGMDEIG